MVEELNPTILTEWVRTTGLPIMTAVVMDPRGDSAVATGPRTTAIGLRVEATGLIAAGMVLKVETSGLNRTAAMGLI